MAIEKPAPLMIGNKAFYSLSSCDPVEIQLEVPLTTDFDVELALEAALSREGGTRENLSDSAWIAEHFDGVDNADELRKGIREQLSQVNSNMAEQQKMGKAVAGLAQRLGQSVPEQHIAMMRQMVEMRFAQQLQADGIDLNTFMKTTGMTQASIDAMFDSQAKEMAEGEAALDAFARERKLKITEDEIGPLLNLSPDEAKDIIERARSAAQYSELESSALHAKAASIVVAECSCTYHHETVEEAEARVEQYRALIETAIAEQDDEDDKGDGAGLHLV